MNAITHQFDVGDWVILPNGHKAKVLEVYLTKCTKATDTQYQVRTFSNGTKVLVEKDLQPFSLS